MNPSGHPIIERVRRDLAAHADPVRAVPMQAYMKTEQPFHGVSAPLRKTLLRAALKDHPIGSPADYELAIRGLWAGTRREEMYQALEIAERYPRFNTSERMPLWADLLSTATNWDLVDNIAGSPVSNLVKADRTNEAWLIGWRTHENMWFRRSSLLGHLKHRTATNKPLLAESIDLLAAEREFFIRKAIGWVLRDLSYADPAWVEEFVAGRGDRLSGLSRREALKAIERKRGKASQPA